MREGKHSLIEALNLVKDQMVSEVGPILAHFQKEGQGTCIIRPARKASKLYLRAKFWERHGKMFFPNVQNLIPDLTASDHDRVEIVFTCNWTSAAVPCLLRPQTLKFQCASHGYPHSVNALTNAVHSSFDSFLFKLLDALIRAFIDLLPHTSRRATPS